MSWNLFEDTPWYKWLWILPLLLIVYGYVRIKKKLSRVR